jgi:hypothetical protein
MPAVAYHCQAKVISRSAGQSAVAAAAYRTGLKLEDERYGKTQDYSRKNGVEFVYHAVPANAPAWAQDVGQAWNAIEREENRKNSTLAREYVAAFPHQLTAEQRQWMVKDFVREEFTRKGLIATAAIHAPGQEGDQRNYHAHIMFSDRPIDENGFAKTKDRSFTEFESRKDTLEHAREKWATLGARQLERAGYSVEAERWRHGHQTLKEQTAQAEARGDLDYAEAIRDREGTKHLGVTATAMERDGRESDRGNINRELMGQQAEVTALDLELQAVHRQMLAVLQEPEPVQETAYQAAAQEQTQTATIAQPAPEIEPMAAIFEELPSVAEVGEHLEHGADVLGNAGAKGLGAALKAVETLALGAEEFLFGGSRQAPGGAESTQEAPPQPKQTLEQKQEPQKSMKETPAWLKPRELPNGEPEFVNEANIQDLIAQNPSRVSPEIEAAVRRNREARERQRDYDRER